MVGNRVLDDPEQFLLRIGGANRETVKKLNHQTGETFKGTGNTNGGVDLNQNPLGGMDVDLKFPGLVGGRVEESEETLSNRELTWADRRKQTDIPDG